MAKPDNRRKQANRGQFQPGRSGNPGGRPKLPAQIVELRALAREHTPAALEAIVAVMADLKAPPSARVAAASEILDRGWGRPTAALEHSGPDGGPVAVALTPVDWDALLCRITGQATTVPEADGGCLE